MRGLLVLLLLGALAGPALAHPRSPAYTHCGPYGRPAVYAHECHRFPRPYWHHPYYRRYGYERPYLFHRRLRAFGYGLWVYAGCGGLYDYTYYAPYVSVAPVYSRLGVALTLDDPVLVDADGLPRARTGPVGDRFLADVR